MKDSELETIFSWMAKGLNDFAARLDAFADGARGLRLHPFTGVVWEVKYAAEERCLKLTQLAQMDGGGTATLHEEHPFSFGHVNIELGATDAEAQANYAWLMCKLAVTYIHMLRDPQAHAEEGWNWVEAMATAARFKPFSEIAYEIHDLNAIEQLVPIYDVRAPYRVAI